MAVLWALAMLPVQRKRHGRLLSNVQPEKRRDVSCWPIPAVAGIYTARQLSGDGRKGKLERAIDDYNQAIQLNPNYSWAYYRRAQAYSNRREFARAIRDYDETIRLDPGNAKAFNDRGFAYASQGDLDRAIGDYSQAVRIDHNYA